MDARARTRRPCTQLFTHGPRKSASTVLLCLSCIYIFAFACHSRKSSSVYILTHPLLTLIYMYHIFTQAYTHTKLSPSRLLARCLKLTYRTWRRLRAIRAIADRWRYKKYKKHFIKKNKKNTINGKRYIIILWQAKISWSICFAIYVYKIRKRSTEPDI